MIRIAFCAGWRRVNNVSTRTFLLAGIGHVRCVIRGNWDVSRRFCSYEEFFFFFFFFFSFHSRVSINLSIKRKGNFYIVRIICLLCLQLEQTRKVSRFEDNEFFCNAKAKVPFYPCSSSFRKWIFKKIYWHLLGKNYKIICNTYIIKNNIIYIKYTCKNILNISFK